MSCEYCGRDAHYGDRDCHGCGAPVRWRFVRQEHYFESSLSTNVCLSRTVREQINIQRKNVIIG